MESLMVFSANKSATLYDGTEIESTHRSPLHSHSTQTLIQEPRYFLMHAIHVRLGSNSTVNLYSYKAKYHQLLKSPRTVHHSSLQALYITQKLTRVCWWQTAEAEIALVHYVGLTLPDTSIRTIIPCYYCYFLAKPTFPSLCCCAA